MKWSGCIVAQSVHIMFRGMPRSVDDLDGDCCIKCPECHKQYVGQTYQRLKDQVRQHPDPNHNPNQALKKHYLQNKNHKLTDMRFQILEALDPQTTRDEALELLPKLETKWINNLHLTLQGGPISQAMAGPLF